VLRLTAPFSHGARLGWEMGIESALKRKCKDLQSTAGNVSTWKATVVHVNGSQMDRRNSTRNVRNVPKLRGPVSILVRDPSATRTSGKIEQWEVRGLRWRFAPGPKNYAIMTR
jgi:hypothetical protein